tara:strand:+ start:304 stop:513 length:210 start_codon:yes stop_codon:yes gene_type:complete
MFFKKLYLWCEILGYSRAIGVALNDPRVHERQVRFLYESRDEAKARLKALKTEAHVKRFGNTVKRTGTA